MPTIIITLPDGSTNRIEASEEYAQQVYPGRWVLAPNQAPAPTTPPPPPRLIRTLSLKLRMSQLERIAYRVAAKVSDEANDFMDLLNSPGGVINLDNPLVRAGLAAVLGQARADAIVDAPLQPDEQP